MVALLGSTGGERRREYHRTCYRAIAGTPLKVLLQHREELDSAKEGMGVEEEGEEVEPGSLLLAFSLVGHRTSMTPQRMTPLLLSALFQLRSLQTRGYFPTRRIQVKPVLEGDELWVAELLYSLFEKMQWNTHSVVEGKADEEPTEPMARKVFENRMQPCGLGLYPTFALFNHSCANNVAKYFIGSVLVVQASTHIRAGEEITENYHPPAMMIGREERRAYLSTNYSFHCCCWACEQDLPDIRSMSSEVVVVRCPACRGAVDTTTSSRCCGEEVPIALLRSKVAEVWTMMQEEAANLKTARPLEELVALEGRLTSLYSSLLDTLAHPCTILYQAEQMFWKSQRLARGNKAYLHKGEHGRRYLLETSRTPADA